MVSITTTGPQSLKATTPIDRARKATTTIWVSNQPTDTMHSIGNSTEAGCHSWPNTIGNANGPTNANPRYAGAARYAAIVNTPAMTVLEPPGRWCSRLISVTRGRLVIFSNNWPQQRP